jgi:anti-sigma28 factor (negative regulator of flagellin synthesis)
MSKITKGNLVILAVLLALCNLESRAADKQEADAQQKVENPYEKAAVTIDASVIEVNLHSAEQLVMAPRGSKGESVSLEKLQAAINKGAAKVTAGTKLAAQSNQIAAVKCFQKTNVAVQNAIVIVSNQSEAPKTTSYQTYDIGMAFTAQPFVSPDGGITLSYKFEQTGFNNVSQTGKAPDTFARSLEGKLRLESGKPIIAGSAQNNDEAYFLVISATIESK